MVSSLGLLRFTSLTVTRGDETHEDPEIILARFPEVSDCGLRGPSKQQ